VIIFTKVMSKANAMAWVKNILGVSFSGISISLSGCFLLCLFQYQTKKLETKNIDNNTGKIIRNNLKLSTKIKNAK